MRAGPVGEEPRLHTCHLGGQEEFPLLAVTHGSVPRKLLGSSGPLGVSRQLPGAAQEARVPRGGWRMGEGQRQ